MKNRAERRIEWAKEKKALKLKGVPKEDRRIIPMVRGLQDSSKATYREIFKEIVKKSVNGVKYVKFIKILKSI